MAKKIDIEDQVRRLEGSRNAAAKKLGTNGAATKADSQENEYAATCAALHNFTNGHGLTNHIRLKKKYTKR